MNCVCNYVLVCTDNTCDTVRVYVCVDRQKKKKKSLCVCGYLGVSRLDVYLFFCVLVLYNNLYVRVDVCFSSAQMAVLRGWSFWDLLPAVNTDQRSLSHLQDTHTHTCMHTGTRHPSSHTPPLPHGRTTNSHSHYVSSMLMVSGSAGHGCNTDYQRSLSHLKIDTLQHDAGRESLLFLFFWCWCLIRKRGFGSSWIFVLKNVNLNILIEKPTDKICNQFDAKSTIFHFKGFLSLIRFLGLGRYQGANPDTSNGNVFDTTRNTGLSLCTNSGTTSFVS